MKTVKRIWLTENAVWIETADGDKACEYFADYPRLSSATPEQIARYKVDDFGISWPELDEDLSFEGFFLYKGKTDLYRLFIAHPELNASAVARRMGMSQSLFAQYISGAKKPSKKRMCEIYETIGQIGSELVSLTSSLSA